MHDGYALAPKPPFDESDIRRCMPGELEKGRDYCRRGAVAALKVENDGKRLVAEVKGTAAHPYVVRIDIAGRRLRRLIGQCTCPVSFNCKHCTAALLQAMETPPAGFGAGFGTVGNDKPIDPLSEPLRGWLVQLAREVETPDPPDNPEILFYRLVPPRRDIDPVQLEARVARRLKSGRYGAGRPCSWGEIEAGRHAFVASEDRFIARLLGAGYYRSTSLPQEPAVRDQVLRSMIETGRCRWNSLEGPALSLGSSRRGRLLWQLTPEGRQCVEASLPEDGVEIIASAAPWYVDPEKGVAGPIDLGLPPPIVTALLRAPPVGIDEAEALGDALRAQFPDLDLPLPRRGVVEEIHADPPVNVLMLSTRSCRWGYGWGRASDKAAKMIDIAMLGFEYGGKMINTRSAPPEQRHVENDRVIVRRRNYIAEKAAHDRLTGFGFDTESDFTNDKGEGKFAAFSLAMDPSHWAAFLYEELPALERDGWRIETDPEFRPKLLDASGEWDARLSEGSGWWFSLELGVEIGGERVPLLPVLTSLLRRVRALGAEGSLDALARNGTVLGELPDGRHIALPLDRVKAILGALIDLYNTESGDGTTGVSLSEAAALAAIEDSTRLRWLGGERLRAMAQRLRNFSSIAAVAPPAGLDAQLRAYQQDGLNWLQFLREYELGGILADDMGLGKTVQTLAHILVEKREGRLDRPCLVVCPTSVIPNWRAEAARLAPELRVLALHGSDRGKRFAQIPDHDLVLTTYALLPRDADRLLPVPWHMAVLDEAQAIKNATSQATQIACKLDARHRLCLTGTPVENHLGELWSQFAFLMPGLLGDAKRFGRVFRNPIEKRGDSERAVLLASRLKPFMLRRTKTNVAADLPPKTEIKQPLELTGAQRDLYETVRLAMHEKVRQEIAAKGLARSHIIILDALLKMRQVCCDPRLVKLAAAKGVTASAKLGHLMGMLPPMIEEGRRILLFSQFTSMLDLIKPEIAKTGIEFVELRGDTIDRAAPVRRFQDGEVPLFLISLKAGGTGLNLTAADTVIHYDPWWNPAVEDQATDRAHRIGQDKSVFVYKLVTQGTVEERMIELQDRKRAIASGVLGDGGETAPALAAADLERLFEPLG